MSLYLHPFLVITALLFSQVDLLPRGAVVEDVRRWLERMALAKQLNFINNSDSIVSSQMYYYSTESHFNSILFWYSRH